MTFPFKACLAVFLIFLATPAHADTPAQIRAKKRLEARAKFIARREQERAERDRLAKIKCQAHEVTQYDPDSSHPLNQIHEALYVRRGDDGCFYGTDTLEPIL